MSLRRSGASESNSVAMSGLQPLISQEARRTLAQLDGCFFCSKSFSTGEAKRVLYATANSMRHEAT